MISYRYAAFRAENVMKGGGNNRLIVLTGVFTQIQYEHQRPNHKHLENYRDTPYEYIVVNQGLIHYDFPCYVDYFMCFISS